MVRSYCLSSYELMSDFNEPDKDLVNRTYNTGKALENELSGVRFTYYSIMNFSLLYFCIGLAVSTLLGGGEAISPYRVIFSFPFSIY